MWPEDVWEQDKPAKRMFSKTWIDGVVRYTLEVSDENGNMIGFYYMENPNEALTLDLSSLSDGTHTLRLRGYYSYTIAPVNSGVIDQYVEVHVSHPIIPETPVIPDTPSNPEA